MNLPINYDELTTKQRREVREEYERLQGGRCFYCGKFLCEAPEQTKIIDWNLFPTGFLNYPVHLQHSHETGLTEGAVHAYCNAVMWQYENR